MTELITITLTREAHGFWLTLIGIAAFCGLITLISLGHNGSRDPTLDRLATRLGAQNLPPILFVLALLIYTLTAISLGIGLIWSIWTLIWPMMNGQGLGENPGQIRFAFVPIAVYVGALGALIALPFTVLRTQFTARQTTATEEGLITDRINAAVASLGAEKQVSEHIDTPDGPPTTLTLTKPNLEVRIGALLALERISVKNCTKDPDLHVQIMEIICAYIRENAPASSAEASDLDGWLQSNKPQEYPPHRPKPIELDNWALKLPEPRIDIQTAMTVLGRRTADQKQSEQLRKYKLDIRKTNLQKLNLQGLDFANTNFFEAKMDGCFLLNGTYANANFSGGSLIGCSASNTNFSGSKMAAAHIESGNFNHANFEHTEFSRTFFHGTSLDKARFSFAPHPIPLSIANHIFLVRCSLSSAAFTGQGFNPGANFLHQTDETAMVSEVRGSCFRDLILPDLFAHQTVLKAIFADGSVTLPKGTPRPAHWPTEALDSAEFSRHWHAWQATLEPGWDN